MVGVSNSWWDSLVKWNAPGFLFAGFMEFSHAVLKGPEAYDAHGVITTFGETIGIKETECRLHSLAAINPRHCPERLNGWAV